MRWSRILQTTTAILIATSICSTTQALTIHVPGDAATIAEGLLAATMDDTVLVAPGVYLEHDLLIPAGICLRGATGDPVDVVVDAQRLGRVLACFDISETVRIEALTLTGGLATLESPGSNRGGGLHIAASAAEVRNCHILDNEADLEGGGIAFSRGAGALIADCLIAGNRSVDGAGIACHGSSPRVENCVVVANDALFWGGALFCRLGSNPRVVCCTMVANEAHWGAGIWAVGCPDIEVENSIIAFGLDGEGVYAYDNPSYPSEIRLSCCDVFGNEGGDYGGTTPDQTGTDGNIADDPYFCDPENFDYTLAADSPCLPANNDCNVLFGALAQGCELPTAVDDDAGGEQFPVTQLVRINPNPFNASLAIRFTMPQPGGVRIRVYDMRGQLVRELLNENRSEGIHDVNWSGKDDAGMVVASGSYTLRLDLCGTTVLRQVVMLK